MFSLLCYTLVIGSISSLSATEALDGTKKVAISLLYNKTTATFDVSNTFDTSADSYGYYYTNVNNSYWNYLEVYGQSEVDSVEDHLLYSNAMGYLEGYATCQEIKVFWGNFYSAMFGTDIPGSQTIEFLRANYDWLNEMVALHAASDDYWYTIQSLLQQLNGVHAGYAAGCASSKKEYKSSAEIDFSNLDNPTLEHFLLLNAWGDLYQITMKYRESGRAARLMGNRSIKDGKKKLIERCSAIIKLLPDKSDVVYGHSTWDTYESLGPRIIKHMSLPLMRKGFAESHYDVYFSSSPGLLTSVDDFFTVSGYSKLGVMETTNSLYNLKLLEEVVPRSVLSWTRSVTSNQMATSGADWVNQFARYHSGTYTNQWMVLDLNLFVPGSNPTAGFLSVFEEVPGLYVAADVTQILNDDLYWASYNVPYFPSIANASGYAKVCKYDFTACHDTAPRAVLFKEHQSNVTNLDGGNWILSYNDFRNDKVSINDSCNTIACRGDLEPNSISIGAFGALDSKVSSAKNAKREPGVAPYFIARLGPTSQQQPKFCWSGLKDQASYVHNGQPDCFDYSPNPFPV